MSASVEEVRAILRADIARAKAAGMRIERGDFFQNAPDGKAVACCALGATLLMRMGPNAREDHVTVANFLRIGTDDTDRIATGFDGDPRRHGDDPWYDLGRDLAKEEGL